MEIRKTAPAEFDFPFRAIVYVPKVGIVGLFDCEGITDDEGFGEWADDYLSDVTKEQYQELEERLDAVFNEWIEKNGLHAGFYKINSYSEYLFDKAEGEFVTPEIYYNRRANKEFSGKGKE